ncbi:MAG: hypothetical protein LBF25_02450, partial [Puniceicoccales bacterium]|nr:hypothetical protein [Puniceicoccales bacterium]
SGISPVSGIVISALSLSSRSKLLTYSPNDTILARMFPKRFSMLASQKFEHTLLDSKPGLVSLA